MIVPPPAYSTPLHVRHLIASAYSTRFNSRNLEVDHYTGYDDSLSELVRFSIPDGTLAARQQHNFWLTKEIVDLHELSRTDADAAYHDGYSDVEGKSMSPHFYARVLTDTNAISSSRRTTQIRAPSRIERNWRGEERRE